MELFTTPIRRMKDKIKFQEELYRPLMTEAEFKAYRKSKHNVAHYPDEPKTTAMKCLEMSQLILRLLTTEVLENNTSEQLHIIYGMPLNEGWDKNDKPTGKLEPYSHSFWMDHLFEEYERRMMAFG